MWAEGQDLYYMKGKVKQSCLHMPQKHIERVEVWLH